MAVSLSIGRGVEGFKVSDFTVGTSAPGAGDIELRFGTTVTRLDVVKACKAFQRAVEEGQLITNAPPL
jgi:hypothetical protein